MAVEEKNRIVYVEPNNFPAEMAGKANYDMKLDNITWAPEDMNISVDLQVVIPSRLYRESDIQKDSNFEQAMWERQSILSGEQLSSFGDNKFYLTDDYTAISYQEIKNNNAGSREMLGINSINISFDSHLYPRVKMTFTDVRGAALMMPQEQFVYDINGNDNIKEDKVCKNFFQSFFKFPYPRFLLSVKGIYGTCVTFVLSVEDFRATFNSETGNFDVNVSFIGLMYGLYTDIPMNYLIIAPYIGGNGGHYKNEYWLQQTKPNGKFFYNEDGADGIPIMTFFEFRQKYSNFLTNESNSKSLYGGDNIKKIAQLYKENSAISHLISDFDAIYSKVNSFTTAHVVLKSQKHVIFNIKPGSVSNTFIFEKTFVENFSKDYDYYTTKLNTGITVNNTVEPVVYNLTHYETICEGGSIEKPFEKKENKYILGGSNNLSSSDAFTDAEKEELLSYFNSVKEEDLSGVRSFLVYKESNFRSRLQQRQKAISDEISTYEPGASEEMKKAFKTSIGFSPTIENIMRMIFAHLDTFIHEFYGVISEASKSNRTVGSLKWDIKYTDIQSSSDKGAAIPPFTAFYKPNEDKKRERIYPGDDYYLSGITEVAFVESILKGLDNELAKEKNEILNAEPVDVPPKEGNQITSQDFKPIAVTDIFYDGKNPYDYIVLNNDIYSLLYFFVCRLGVAMRDDSKNIDTAIKCEVENLKNSALWMKIVNDDNLKNTLRNFNSSEYGHVVGEKINTVAYSSPSFSITKGDVEGKKYNFFKFFDSEETNKVSKSENSRSGLTPLSLFVPSDKKYTENDILNFKSKAPDYLGFGDDAKIKDDVKIHNEVKGIYSSLLTLKENKPIGAKIKEEVNVTTKQTGVGNLQETPSTDIVSTITYGIYDINSSFNTILINSIEKVPFYYNREFRTVDLNRILKNGEKNNLWCYGLTKKSKSNKYSNVFFSYDSDYDIFYYGKTTVKNTKYVFNEKEIATYLLFLILNGYDYDVKINYSADGIYKKYKLLYYFIGGYLWLKQEETSSTATFEDKAAAKFLRDKIGKKINGVKIENDVVPSEAFLGPNNHEKLIADFEAWCADKFVTFLENLRKEIFDTTSNAPQPLYGSYVMTGVHNKIVLDNTVPLLFPKDYFKDKEGLTDAEKIRRNTQVNIVQDFLINLLTEECYISVFARKASDTGDTIANVADTYFTTFISKLQEAIEVEETKEEARLSVDLNFSSDQSQKNSIYYTLKNLYDRWLCSYTTGQFTLKSVKEEAAAKERKKLSEFDDNDETKTSEFDNFLYVDSFFNDISKKFYINPETFFNIIKGQIIGDTNFSVLEFIGKICQDNKLLFKCLPVYNNLYSAETFKQIFVPHSLYSDRRKTTRKIGNTYLIMYTYEPSHHLNLVQDKSNDVGFENDSFDIADSFGKITPEALEAFGNNDENYNICAFGVTPGKQNQSYFTKVSVGMDNPRITDFVIKNKFQLANLSKGGVGESVGEGQDMFSIYSNRAYDCKVEMLGCADIMPMMYFQLNNVPMFKGTYMITKVEHNIQNNTMTTSFVGQRMPKQYIPFNNSAFNLSALSNIINRLVEEEDVSILTVGTAVPETETAQESVTSSPTPPANTSKQSEKSTTKEVTKAANNQTKQVEKLADYWDIPQPEKKVTKTFYAWAAVQQMNQLMCNNDKTVALRRPIKGTASGGFCATAVAMFIFAGFEGVVPSNTEEEWDAANLQRKDRGYQIGNGYWCKYGLAKRGFKCIAKGSDTIDKMAKDGKLKVGDICVMYNYGRDKEPSKDKNGNWKAVGHIAMWAGKENGFWVSDYKQSKRKYYNKTDSSAKYGWWCYKEDTWEKPSSSKPYLVLLYRYSGTVNTKTKKFRGYWKEGEFQFLKTGELPPEGNPARTNIVKIEKLT